MRPGASYRHQRRPADTFQEFEHGDEIVIAQIRNLSRFGARVDGDFNLSGPDTVNLIHGGQKYPAAIVWIQIGSLGLAFHDPLDKATYAGILGIPQGRGPAKANSRFMVT